jgi:hypothetical protein
MEISLEVLPSIDFVIDKDDHNNCFFKLTKGEKTLHLTIALQQWLRERAEEWQNESR